MLQTECAATNKSKFVDHHQSSSRSVAIAASATSSSAASTFVVNHSSSSSNILSSSVLQTKASSSSLTSNISKTYCNTTTNVVTRKRGGLAIAIKRQDSIDAYGSNYNNSGRNITPLSSRQSSYSVPPTPLTPTVPTLRRGISVREVEAATEICIGNGDNATNSRGTATQHRELSCLERFRENLYRLFGKIMGSRTPSEADGYDYYDYSELEEFETPARYRPDSLSALSRTTRFTEDEIKRIYRGFKAECPTGVVKEDTFKLIYSQFFPQGANPTLYAHYVFNTLDQDHSGIISFEDFVQGLSILSRGSVEEKLRWTFSLYDINGDGFITREEMTDIVTAIYELMGRLPDECPEEEKIKCKVDHIFQKMDKNGDGVVTLDEFLETCRSDEAISRSMSVFDSAF